MNRLKPVELKIKEGVFGLSRVLLKMGRSSLADFDPESVRKVLFIRPEKIGDMVVSLPTFDVLRRGRPQIEQALLASPVSFPLVNEDPRFDRVYVYRKNASDLAELGRIKDVKYDAVIDMTHGDSVTALFYSQLAAPGAWRFGVGKQKHAPYYDFNGQPDIDAGEHIVDVTLRLLEPFGLTAEESDRFAPPYLGARAVERRDAFYDSMALKGDEVLIGFNLSAGKPNRIWPMEKAVALGEQLTSLSKLVRLVIVTAPADRQRGERLRSHFDERVHHVPPGLNLIEASAVVGRLDLLITPDTSMVHIARSFGVPVVGLYNGAQRNLRLWQPYRQPEGVVVADHPDEIHDITPEQVMAKVTAILGRERLKV